VTPSSRTFDQRLGVAGMTSGASESIVDHATSPVLTSNAVMPTRCQFLEQLP